jgi:uncharacterized membrane protein
VYARRMRNLGRLLFVVGVGGLGIFVLTRDDFTFVWPKALGLSPMAGHILGALLVLIAAALLANRFLAALPIYIALVLLAPAVFLLRDWNIGNAVGVCELLAAFCGSWALANLPRQRIVQVIYGLCLVLFGISHFVYASYTAGMVPAFIPGHLFFAYFTGVAHGLAGLAIVSGVLASYAAIAEAAMLTGFLLLLHVPSLFVAVPWTSNRTFVLSEFLFATIATASAWCMAASQRGRIR